MAQTMKKRPKNVLLVVTIMVFLVSSLLYFTACIFFRTYENYLSTQKQTLEEKIVDIQMQNEETQSEVNELASNQRVTAMSGDKLTYQGQNIESVTDK